MTGSRTENRNEEEEERGLEGRMRGIDSKRERERESKMKTYDDSEKKTMNGLFKWSTSIPVLRFWILRTLLLRSPFFLPTFSSCVFGYQIVCR